MASPTPIVGLSKETQPGRLSEHELQQKASELQATLAAFPDLHFRIDYQGTILSFNAGPSAQLYVPADQFVGRRMMDVLPDEVARLCAEALLRLHQRRTVQRIEYPLEMDGHEQWFEARMVPLLEDQVLVIVRDITERRSTELQLRFQKTLFESLSEASIDGILVVGADRTVLYHNQRFRQMWDIPQPLMEVRSDQVLLEYVLKKLRDPQEFITRVQDLYQSPDQRSQEEITLADGRCFERYSAPISDRSGAHHGRVWFFRDITDRKQAQEAMRLSEHRLRLLIDQSPLAIQILDPAGYTLRVNRAWEQLWGLTLGDLNGYNLLADEQLKGDDILPYLKRALAGESMVTPPVFYTPAGGRHRNSVRAVRATIYPVREVDGQVRQVVLMQEDLTDRLRAENELRTVASHARCILWQGRIEGLGDWQQDLDGSRRSYRWMINILDEHAAQQILPLDIPAGQSYVNVWAYDCRHPVDRDQARARSARALVEGQRGYRQEFRCFDRHGNLHWLHEDVTIQPRGHGHWYAFGVCTDITERVLAEQKLRESEKHYKEAAEYNKRLLMEVDHRVKNNLAGLLSLLALAKEKTRDVDAFAAALESRLLSMSHTHQLLAESGWRELSMESLVTSLLAVMKSMPQHDTPTSVHGPPLWVPPRIALPLTMILAEWFTNSCKYGAHSTPGGRLEIRWSTDTTPEGTLVRLGWRETGGPPIHAPVTTSLGTDLVRSFVARELQGNCELHFPASGADHAVEFVITRNPS